MVEPIRESHSTGSGRGWWRGDPHGGERQLLARTDLELVDVPPVDGPRQPRAAQHQPVRPRDGGDHPDAVHVLAAHPGPDLAVAEPHHPLVAEPHPPLDAGDPADQVGAAVPDRHHVQDGHPAGGRGVRRLEGGAVADVPAGAGDLLVLRGPEQPAPVLRTAQQRGEAGVRVEARQAQPVHRAVLADQRGRAGVAEHGVVLDRERHGVTVAVGTTPVARHRQRVSAVPARAVGAGR